MTNMILDAINILKHVQESDRELYEANESLQIEIPAARQALKDELEAKKSRLHEVQEALKKTQLIQKEKELQLGAKEANIRKYEGQLAQVKTNKEYSALQQEIASLKADNSLLEEEILKFIEEVEAAEEEVQKEKERLKVIEKEFAEKEQELLKKEQMCKDEILKAQKQRDEVIGKVDPKIREKYEIIVKKKQGVALAKVNGEICGACQMLLRPQVLNEIKMGTDVIVCETCSRILYEDPETP